MTKAILSIQDKLRTYPKLIDSYFGTLNLIEGKLKNGNIMARGKFGQSDVATGNKRVYPLPILKREIESLQKEIKSRNGILGELDHPVDGRTRLKNVSHIIKKLEIDDKGNVFGEAEILMDTEEGKKLASIAKTGTAIGISSRGAGSVMTNESGNEVVQDDFKLITFDFVAEPASPEAFPDFFTESNKFDRSSNMADKTKKTVTESTTVTAEDTREKFRSELFDTLNQAKKEIEEKVRSEMFSDPKVANALTVVETLKNVLRPYVLGEDAEVVLKQKDDEIVQLKENIKRQEADIAALTKELSETVQMARELGWKVYLENKLKDNPDAALIRDFMGEYAKIEKGDQLKERLETAMQRVKEIKDKHKLESTEPAKKLTVEDLKKKNEQLKIELDQTTKLAEDSALFAYIEQKIANNPRAPELRKTLKAMKFESKEDVDKVLEELLAKPVSKYFQQMKEALENAKGKTRTANAENNTTTKKSAVVQQLQEEIGVSIEEVEKFSNFDYHKGK